MSLFFLVIPAWKEPFPGWVDSPAALTGILMEGGNGTNRTILCKDKYHAEIIPVDIVVDTIITSAWHVTTQR